MARQPKPTPTRCGSKSNTRSGPPAVLALLGVLFFVKFLLLIPHIIIITFLGLAQSVVVYIAYWAVLITGRYPGGCSTSAWECSAGTTASPCG